MINSVLIMFFNLAMLEIIQSDEFKTWHGGLRDPIGRARITSRIPR